jgi:hypothetical protein
MGRTSVRSLALSLALAGVIAVAWSSLQLPQRQSFSVESPWFTNPEIGVALLEHLSVQRRSLRSAPAEVVRFDLNFDATSAPSCDTLYSIAGGLNPVAGAEWYTVVSQGAATVACAGDDTLPLSEHKIWFADEDKLATIADGITPHPTPSCRNCASRLLVVHSRNYGGLVDRMGKLLDGDLRWQILRDLSNGTHGSWFALRQQPLPIQEQAFLKDMFALQTLDTPCKEQKFVVWEMMDSGLGSNIDSMAKVTRYSVYVKRALIILPNPTSP